ncbi:5-methyltetrahydropteroyltriglutamate/homocystei neS-methyltransferase [Blastocladiella britannica]|nr:5-methyltetrahydropteroyltriglutamate/homocystei neS-methyltransferase [Blastocladiella britannica]
MTASANLGFPRIGSNRQLKKLIESFWSSKITAAALADGAKALRAEHWRVQADAGIDVIPSNDFSFYDHILDHMVLFDAVPAFYRGIQDPLDKYFAMARGMQSIEKDVDVPAIEMKKWFDTNYHYIVPRFNAETKFALPANIGTAKPVAEFIEARDAGFTTRPVLVGPVSFLLLGRSTQPGFNPLSLLPALLPHYSALLTALAAAGATRVQLDEPVLVLDLAADARAAFTTAYAHLATAIQAANLEVTVASYFGDISPHADLVASLPGVSAVHIDLVRAPSQIDVVAAALRPTTKRLSLGLVNGRNVWKADIHHALTLARHAIAALGGGNTRVIVAPSCSLLHSPVSLAAEGAAPAVGGHAGRATAGLDEELRAWLAFATEKLAEVRTIARALDDAASVGDVLVDNARAIAARRTSTRIHRADVKARIAGLTPEAFRRLAPFADRWAQQQGHLNLPLFATTTVGSFPQTKEVRAARAAWKKGTLPEQDYAKYLDEEMEKCIRIQEDLGLDVLVHGEFERNDMVEYFGELLDGYVFTRNGWVQSYGSRCVKPPIIYGDVHRPLPMTVATAARAQSLTAKPVKGMLTGPITMLQWSFVRDDQPRKTTALQLALAIRDEVVDLEAAGIKAIQIDEPAIREGLPLRANQWAEYLEWAVDAFKLSTCGVNDKTQIHSHMFGQKQGTYSIRSPPVCYSDFNDIISDIIRMDVDVLSIEAAKSDLKLLSAFDQHAYINHIGPGTFDIHSPRVPAVGEMLDKAVASLMHMSSIRQLWINPDCGLKTRGWTETKAALANMVAVAVKLRSEVRTEADVKPFHTALASAKGKKFAGLDGHQSSAVDAPEAAALV